MNAKTKNILKMVLPALLVGSAAAGSGYAFGKKKDTKNLTARTTEKKKIARYFYSLGQKNMYDKFSGILKRR